MINFDSRNYRKHNDKNKNLINKSLSECGAGRSILIDSENNIIAGNGVYEQAKKLKMPVKVVETDGSELVVVKRTDLSTDDDKRKQLAVMDNSTSDSSEFDFDLLGIDFIATELEDMGIEIPTMDDFVDEKKSKYTRKISLPIYEIKGEKPQIKELINTDKADKLVEEIKACGFDKDLEEFLIKTATRLYDFNYAKIAEYYVHQEADVQKVMEKLALVLIDFDSAVENGYVELNQFIENCFLQDRKNNADE